VSIVVTGVGLVSPWGHDLETFRAALALAPPAARALNVADWPGAPFPAVPLAPGPDPEASVRRRKDVRLMARANVLAVAAARRAVADAGLTEDDPRLEGAGLFVAAGREPGNLDDVRDALAHARSEDDPTHVSLSHLAGVGMHRMNPLASIKTLPNRTFAHVGITLGLRGPGMTLTDDAAAGLGALAEAVRTLETGRATMCLVGAADAHLDFAGRVTALREGRPGPISEAAVFFVLETAELAAARGARVRGSVTRDDERPAKTTNTAQPLQGISCGTPDALLILLAGPQPDRLEVRWLDEGASSSARVAAPVAHVRGTPRRVVAITGIGLRTPLGHTLEAFSTRVLGGSSAVAPIRAFDATPFPTRLACEIETSTAALLAALPEALHVSVAGLDDRKGALALAAALDAVVSRGRPLPTDTAIAYGTGLSSVSLRELSEDCLPFLGDDGRFDYAAFARAGLRASAQAPRRHAVTAPLRALRRHLDVTGPFDVHFSACAAAAAAIGHAVDRVRSGEVDVALAGGADSMIHPFGLLPFMLLGATSAETDPFRAARPFDRARAGFVMGEGAAFYVLEPLDRVLAEGRTPLAVLLGHGTSGDAHNVTAPHPEGLGARLAMSRALTDAGVRPEHVDYVNAHGTGTPLNDVTEAAAIRAVFGAHGPAVSSTKGQVGHTIAAAETVELLACVAALRGGRLPPGVGLENPDPRIEVDLVPAEGRVSQPHVIMSNSFGFGGQNAVLLLASAERLDPRGALA
jgi:3-oxoacyl-(acyl-carrier-protein) synthase